MIGALLLVCGMGMVPLFLSWRFTSHLRAARQDLDRHDAAAARAHLRLCREARPGDPEVHRLLARASRQDGHFADAEFRLDLCQKMGGAAEAIQLERALLQAQQGQWSPALELQLQNYIDQDHPELLAILDAASEGAVKTYRLESARYCLDRWLERQPNNVRALLRRGWVWERLHQLPKAAADYRQAIAAEPDNTTAQLRMAQLLLQQLGEAQQAAELFTALRQRQPEEVPVLLGLASCHRLLGENEAAERLIADLAARRPDDPAVLLERGQLALNRQNPQQAERWLRRAVELAPQEYQTNYALFLCLQQLNKKAEAEKVRQRVTRIEADLKRLNDLIDHLQGRPYDADMRCEVGRLFLRSGEEREGILWLESALQVAPDHRPSHQALAEHYVYKGQAELASPHKRFLAAPSGPAAVSSQRGLP